MVLSEAVEVILGQRLMRLGLKLAVAESCTGGLIGDRITNVAGSSEYFLGGVIAYAYEVKVSLLGVSWDTLKEFGAVSREVVLDMARGARRAIEADVAVSVSGIAGPGGGTPEKPVGTVWVGVAGPGFERAEIFHFQGDRETNKRQAAEAALSLLCDVLAKEYAE
jgi:PncC family amidohydrolase